MHYTFEISENELRKFKTLDDEKLELFFNYMPKGKDDITEEELIQVSKIVNDCWGEMKYNLHDFSLFVQTMEFLAYPEVKFIEKMFLTCGIKLTPKDRKKGVRGYQRRMMLNFHKGSVRKKLREMFNFFASDEADRLKESPTEEALKELVSRTSMEQVYWLCIDIIKDETLIKKLEDTLPYEYTNMLITMLFIYIRSDFNDIMDNPETMRKNFKFQKTDELAKENKTLKKKMGKVEKEEKALKRELYNLSKERKQLKTEIHSLYEESLKEIERLKRQNDELVTAFDIEREHYLNLIRELNDQASNNGELSIHQNDAETFTSLKGKSIAVIGGNKERPYSEIVSNYDGEIKFVSVDDYNKIEGAISQSSAVFFLTELVGHKHFRKALAASKSKGIPFIFVNSRGSSTFEKQLQLFASKNKEEYTA